MCNEISPWKFVVNALYSIKGQEPLSLNPDDKTYFWAYTLIASQTLKEKLADICVYADRRSLENVLWNDNLYITVKDDKLLIDENVDIDLVNQYLDDAIKGEIQGAFKNAYTALKAA